MRSGKVVLASMRLYFSWAASPTVVRPPHLKRCRKYDAYFESVLVSPVSPLAFLLLTHSGYSRASIPAIAAGRGLTHPSNPTAPGSAPDFCGRLGYDAG